MSRRMAARGLFVVLLVALITTIGPSTWAEGVANDAVIEDPVGDVEIDVNGQRQATAGDEFDHVDIRRVWIREAALDEVEVGIQFVGNDPPAQAPALLQRSFHIHFSRGSVDYRIANPSWGCSQSALQVFDAGRNQFWPTACLTPRIDRGDVTYTYDIPKGQLLNEHHAPLRFQESVERFYAIAYALITPDPSGLTGGSTTGARAIDRAPNEGYGPSFQALQGAAVAGHIELVAPHPIRVSNGESTTIVYKVLATNHGDVEESLLLAVDAREPSWDARVPTTIRLPAQTSVEFPVVLAMEFTHLHGETVFFDVEAQSTRDPSVAVSIRLGVHWLTIPQPAGHHPTLWLHVADHPSDPNNVLNAVRPLFGGKQTWMNAAKADPEGTDEYAPGAFQSVIMGQDFRPQVRTVWWYSLSPALRIGLDFDLDRPVEFVTEFRSPVPVTRGHAEAWLEYCNPEGSAADLSCSGTWETLASGVSENFGITAGGSRAVAMHLEVAERANHLPFQPGSNLRLRVVLVTDTPATSAAGNAFLLNAASSSLTLPLFEYHDPIDREFETVEELGLALTGTPERRVNPGKTTVFFFDLVNHGEQEHVVGLQVHGINAAWASWSEAAPIRLQPGDAQRVHLQVKAPAEAVEGERAELFAVSQSETDPNVVALNRLRITVVQSIEIDDERDLVPVQEHSGQASSLTLTWFLAACASFAMYAYWKRD